jgi:hypothetical protein
VISPGPEGVRQWMEMNKAKKMSVVKDAIGIFVSAQFLF